MLEQCVDCYPENGESRNRSSRTDAVQRFLPSSHFATNKMSKKKEQQQRRLSAAHTKTTTKMCILHIHYHYHKHTRLYYVHSIIYTDYTQHIQQQKNRSTITK